MRFFYTKKVICTATLALATIIFNQYSHASSASGQSVASRQHTNQNVQQATLFQLLPEKEFMSSKGLARQFVKSSQLYKGLSLLLLDSAKTSDIVLQAIEEKGFQNVQTAVIDAINEVTNTYRFQWDDYLTEVYSRQYTPEILTSVLKSRERSPYFKIFISQQAMIYKNGALLETNIFHQAFSDLVHSLEEKFN